MKVIAVATFLALLPSTTEMYGSAPPNDPCEKYYKEDQSDMIPARRLVANITNSFSDDVFYNMHWNGIAGQTDMLNRNGDPMGPSIGIKLSQIMDKERGKDWAEFKEKTWNHDGRGDLWGKKARYAALLYSCLMKRLFELKKDSIGTRNSQNQLITRQNVVDSLLINVDSSALLNLFYHYASTTQYELPGSVDDHENLPLIWRCWHGDMPKKPTAVPGRNFRRGESNLYATHTISHIMNATYLGRLIYHGYSKKNYFSKRGRIGQELDLMEGYRDQHTDYVKRGISYDEVFFLYLITQFPEIFDAPSKAWLQQNGGPNARTTYVEDARRIYRNKLSPCLEKNVEDATTLHNYLLSDKRYDIARKYDDDHSINGYYMWGTESLVTNFKHVPILGGVISSSNHLYNALLQEDYHREEGASALYPAVELLKAGGYGAMAVLDVLTIYDVSKFAARAMLRTLPRLAKAGASLKTKSEFLAAVHAQISKGILNNPLYKARLQMLQNKMGAFVHGDFIPGARFGKDFMFGRVNKAVQKATQRVAKWAKPRFRRINPNSPTAEEEFIQVYEAMGKKLESELRKAGIPIPQGAGERFYKSLSHTIVKTPLIGSKAAGPIQNIQEASLIRKALQITESLGESWQGYKRFGLGRFIKRVEFTYETFRNIRTKYYLNAGLGFSSQQNPITAVAMYIYKTPQRIKGVVYEGALYFTRSAEAYTEVRKAHKAYLELLDLSKPLTREQIVDKGLRAFQQTLVHRLYHGIWFTGEDLLLKIILDIRGVKMLGWAEGSRPGLAAIVKEADDFVASVKVSQGEMVHAMDATKYSVLPHPAPVPPIDWQQVFHGGAKLAATGDILTGVAKYAAKFVAPTAVNKDVTTHEEIEESFEEWRNRHTNLTIRLHYIDIQGAKQQVLIAEGPEVVDFEYDLNLISADPTTKPYLTYENQFGEIVRVEIEEE